jgi:predicted protein tyrosine phosphatase
MSRITEQLFLGGASEASDEEWLKKNHITHIVNCAEEIDSHFPHRFNYLRLNLKDIPEQSLYEVLQRSYEFIRSAISRGGTVYVHCAAGVSRSVSIVVYFLMKLKKWTYLQALHYVRERRSIAQPNQGFARQLVSVSPEARKIFPQNHGGPVSIHAPPEPPKKNLRSKPTDRGSYSSVNSLGPGHSLQGLYGMSS